MAIYGNQLGFFPELFKMYSYFSMDTRTMASYNNRKDLGKIRAILQYVREDRLERENSILGDKCIPTIWTRMELTVGNFIEERDEVYRIVKMDDWLSVGGFYVYELESLVGNDGRQSEHTDVDLGTYD